MKFKRILVIQTAFLGDVILSTPLIRELHYIFPDSIIDTLTIPETKSVFQYNPHVHNTLVFDKRKNSRKWISFIKTISKLRRTKYDAAFSIQSSLTSALLMRLSFIPVRIGFVRQKLLTLPISEKKELHTRQRYLRLLEPFSQRAMNSETEIFWTVSEEKQSEALLQKYGNSAKAKIGIAPGSVWFTKRWPEQYFAELLGLLSNEKFTTFLIGGKTERDLCQRLSGKNIINCAGSLTILESAALIRKLDLMLTNDSAPLHIANAVKTDVLAIFGPTVKDFGFFPFRENDEILEIKNLYCRPCGKHGGNHCPENHFRCMREITPDIVFEAIKRKLNL